MLATMTIACAIIAARPLEQQHRRRTIVQIMFALLVCLSTLEQIKFVRLNAPTMTAVLRKKTVQTSLAQEGMRAMATVMHVLATRAQNGSVAKK